MFRTFEFSASFLLALLASAPAALAAEPLALHPENPHYFVWRGVPTVLITSGEHYGALLNLDFDYVRYFDELAAHGLNHTRTFSGVYLEDAAAFGITRNTLAPASDRYICPWARSDQAGNKAGGNKFDLTRWDPAYFARLHDLLTQARTRGIVVELTLFCPLYNDGLWNISPMNTANNVNGVGDCTRGEVYTLQQSRLLEIQQAVTRKIIQELRDYDNLYYEVCNEPYAGQIPMDWQRAIIDTIVDAEREFPARHLISLNISNGRQQVADPHPAVSIFNFHYCVPPDTVGMNFGLNKVIGENETGFRGRDDVLYRTEGWDFLLAGGGLYNNLDYSFTPQHPDGTFSEYRSPGGGSRALRQQLGILKRFLYGFNFVRMRPDHSVVRAMPPDLSAMALMEDGRQYAIYLHVPLPNLARDLAAALRDNVEATLAIQLPGGPYKAEWVDTKTGEIAGTETFMHSGGERQLVSPRFANDIAVRVLRAE